MTIGRSVVFIMSGGYSFSAIPPGFKAAFNDEALLGLPNLVWLAIALVVLADLFLRHNVWMRKFAFLGGSEIAAIRAGIDTRRLKLAAYVICALLAAVTAIVTTARLGSAFPQTGSGLELRVITAVVVGGCSIYGGRGSVLGSILGVVLLNLISNVLVIMALSVYWQGVAAGIVLLIAILTDMVGKRGAR
jgi:ribose transport system permease protein